MSSARQMWRPVGHIATVVAIFVVAGVLTTHLLGGGIQWFGILSGACVMTAVFACGWWYQLRTPSDR